MDSSDFNDRWNNAASKWNDAAARINDAAAQIQSSVDNATEVKVLDSNVEGGSGRGQMKFDMDSSTSSHETKEKPHQILGIVVDKEAYGIPTEEQEKEQRREERREQKREGRREHREERESRKE